MGKGISVEVVIILSHLDLAWCGRIHYCRLALCVYKVNEISNGKRGGPETLNFLPSTRNDVKR